MPDNDPTSKRDVHPDMPRHRSPFVVMALIMVTLIIVSIWELGTAERVSIRASITVPALNELEKQGQVHFNRGCGDCHGINGTGGSTTGNPLVHPYYRASLLSEEAFANTIKRGAPQRLWKFGHMAAQVHISDEEIKAMFAFFNALRKENGMDD